MQGVEGSPSQGGIQPAMMVLELIRFHNNIEVSQGSNTTLPLSTYMSDWTKVRVRSLLCREVLERPPGVPTDPILKQRTISTLAVPEGGPVWYHGSHRRISCLKVSVPDQRESSIKLVICICTFRVQVDITVISTNTDRSFVTPPTVESSGIIALAGDTCSHGWDTIQVHASHLRG